MTLKELEQTISQLLPGELAEFREWFLRFDGDRWDEQIEKDASSGKLDSLGRDVTVSQGDGGGHQSESKYRSTSL